MTWSSAPSSSGAEVLLRVALAGEGVDHRVGAVAGPLVAQPLPDDVRCERRLQRLHVIAPERVEPADHDSIVVRFISSPSLCMAVGSGPGRWRSRAAAESNGVRRARDPDARSWKGAGELRSEVVAF
jgi:hypothetical protein